MGKAFAPQDPPRLILAPEGQGPGSLGTSWFPQGRAGMGRGAVLLTTSQETSWLCWSLLLLINLSPRLNRKLC